MKLREIERLRAIAALMIIVVHAPPPAGELLRFFGGPRTGVDLFFVISGFVVARSLIRALPDLTDAPGLGVAFDRCREALRTFYVRRFFRIVPLAAVVVAMYRLLVGFGLQIHGANVEDYWRTVFAIFSGVYNYVQPYVPYRQLTAYWSLTVEEHFYLLLPLCFLLARTRNRRAVLALSGMAFVALICRSVFDTPPAGLTPDDYRTFASHLRFDTLLAGVAMAVLFDGPGVKAPGKPFMPVAFMKWVVIPACLILVWAIPRVLPPDVAFHQGFTVTWFLCGILVAYASFDRGYVFQIPVVGRVLEYLGGRSYAIYLLHLPATRLFFNGLVGNSSHTWMALKHEHPWVVWGLFLLTTLIAAELSWHLIELPMQQLGRRLTSDGPPETWRDNKVALGTFAGIVAIGCGLAFWHPVARLLGPKNLALHARVTASPWDRQYTSPDELTNGVLESEHGLETKHDPHPWAMIDLGEEHEIGSVVTFNRADGWQDEVLPRTLEISSDGAKFQRVGVRTDVFSQWLPWTAELGHARARYIRYSGAPDGYICLSEAEVYAP